MKDTTSYENLVKKNAASFHRNFSAGRFDDNGLLVTEDIYVNSNGFLLVGRDKFVERLHRYETAFPKLQLHDRVRITEGNITALHYLMQGTHQGKLGDLESTGNKVDVMSAEFFIMDENDLMKDLFTITQVDKFFSQAKGEEIVDEHEKVDLFPVDETIDRSVSKNTADMYLRHFNARNWSAMEGLLDPQVAVNWNGEHVNGKTPVMNKLRERLTGFPDLMFQLDRIVAEGNRAAIGYTMNATHSGTFNYSGKSYPATGNFLQAREAQHLEISPEGKIRSIIVISDRNEFVKAATGK